MRSAAMVLLFGAVACSRPPPRQTITVAAAANLTQAFDEMGKAFTAATGIGVVYSYGATAQLAQQIENAAPFDVFAAADTEHVDALVAKGRVAGASRAVYARGVLTLWVPPNSKGRIEKLADLAGDSVRFVAIAKPELAPYGQAAVEALTASGIWPRIEPKVVYANNIILAKQYAASNNADAAFTAWSLVLREQGKRIRVDEKLYRPIDQALGVVASTARPEEARRFADFVLGGKGQDILRQFGYETR